MKKHVKLGVVLLAAGRSERYGSNKLLASWRGRPMVCCAIDGALRLDAARVAVVTGNDEIVRIAQAYGCQVIRNDVPQLGQAHSIALGVRAMQGMNAVLLMVCDRPLLTGASLLKLVDAYACSQYGMACLCDDTHRGNPALFSAKYFDQLLALSGDCGAKSILRRHEDDLLVVSCISRHELSDADTPQALARIGNDEL